MIRVVAALALVASASGAASAHKPSDAHVQIVVDGQRVTGSLAVAVRDLDGALQLDLDGNGEVTWAEASAAADRIATYASERLTIAAKTTSCTFSFGAATLVDFSDGAYWTLPIDGTCAAAPETLVVRYALLFDVDAQHRGIVQVKSASTNKTVVVREAEAFTVELGASSSSSFLKLGCWSVLTSLPALLFLACLVLPLVGPRPSLRSLAREVGPTFGAAAIATASALLLSAAHLIYVPVSVIHVVVALSVSAMALIDLLRVREARWSLSFELALVQGLGCWSSFEELGGSSTTGQPFAFVIGVVFGQVVLVVALVAAMVVIRRTSVHRMMLWVVSTIAAIAGMIWTLQLVT